MSLEAWHLPWGRKTVPHALLDIIRGCNIRCAACYNSRPPAIKSLDEIAAELRELLARRRMGSVSLVGGEPLMHPQLVEIVRLAKGHGLIVQIFSNGVLLDDQRLDELKAAGVDIIFVHIDGGQTRPDLPPGATRETLRELWKTKTALIARHGIDVGLTMTAFAERLGEAREMVEFMIDSPHVNYLLITLFRDTENVAEIHGDLDSGLHGVLRNPARPRGDTLNNRQMIAYLSETLGLRPFGYLGSNRDAGDPRWLSYMVATRRGRDGAVVRYALKPSLFEKVFCALSLRFKGKYPMYREQNALELRVQLLLNALAGGDFRGNLKFLINSLRPGVKLGAKRLLFQCPAEIGEDGTVTHCVNCPDAVLKNGGLVPVCIADRVGSIR